MSEHGRWRDDSGDRSDPWSDETVAELLTLSTLTLATFDRIEGPHAAAVYFALAPGDRLVFFSDPGSLHMRQAEEGAAAAAIHPDDVAWTEIRGLQLHGTISSVTAGAAWAAAWDAYCAKFPFVAELGELVERNSLYAFEPTWVRLIDNDRSFGFRREWTREHERA